MEKSWEFRHIGVVVRDMDKAVEYYQSLGIATIAPEHTADNKSLDLMVYGKPADPRLKIKIRMVQIGPVTLELLQPVEGESPHKEFLDSKGEGAHHIAFTVDDLEKERANLVEKGTPIMLTRKDQDSFAYFDIRKVGNIVIELIQRR